MKNKEIVVTFIFGLITTLSWIFPTADFKLKISISTITFVAIGLIYFNDKLSYFFRQYWQEIVSILLLAVFFLLFNNAYHDLLLPAIILLMTSISITLLISFKYKQGLILNTKKFGKKESIIIDKWAVTTDKTTPQWTAKKEINLNGGLLVSAKCSIELKSGYLRFGFKLLDKDAHIFGIGGILTNENNGLFHIGNAINDNKIYMTCYKNGVADRTGNFLSNYSLGDIIKLELRVDNRNNLEFFVNSKKLYQTVIIPEYRERLLLMAWGDGNEYEMIVKDIEITTKV